MLAASNIYGHGFDANQVARPERLGFRVRPQVSIYPGSQMCRFIDFDQGPDLELHEIEDDQTYQDLVPDGMTPCCPGISLALSGASGRTLIDHEREFHQ